MQDSGAVLSRSLVGAIAPRTFEDCRALTTDLQAPDRPPVRFTPHFLNPTCECESSSSVPHFVGETIPCLGVTGFVTLSAITRWARKIRANLLRFCATAVCEDNTEEVVNVACLGAEHVLRRGMDASFCSGSILFC